MEEMFGSESLWEAGRSPQVKLLILFLSKAAVDVVVVVAEPEMVASELSSDETETASAAAPKRPCSPMEDCS